MGSCFISHCVCWFVKKLYITIELVSWLGLYFLSNVIAQTHINDVLAGTVPLKTYLSEQFQQKIKDISSDFKYSCRLLHTHACYVIIKSFQL